MATIAGEHQHAFFFVILLPDFLVSRQINFCSINISGTSIKLKTDAGWEMVIKIMLVSETLPCLRFTAFNRDKHLSYSTHNSSFSTHYAAVICPTSV
jgi:hypothetical protein